MKTIVYEGPENENETSDYLVVEGKRLPLGLPVKVDDDVAKAAQDVEGHKVSEATGAKAKDALEAQDTAPDTNPTDDEAPAPAAGAEQ